MKAQDLLGDLERRVEAHLEETVRVLQNFDEATLSKAAPDGGWSIAQCLWHLNSYGHFYLPLIADALAKPQKAVPFSSGWLGAYFTRMMEPTANGKKYKAFKDHIPPAGIDARYEVAEFIRQQELLLGYLGHARQANLNSRLPVSISKWVRLKLGDVFGFLIAHNERHFVQVRKLY